MDKGPDQAGSFPSMSLKVRAFSKWIPILPSGFWTREKPSFLQACAPGWPAC